MASDGGPPKAAREQCLTEISALLQRALKILDDLGDCTAIGARLQAIIDDLQSGRKTT